MQTMVCIPFLCRLPLLAIGNPARTIVLWLPTGVYDMLTIAETIILVR